MWLSIFIRFCQLATVKKPFSNGSEGVVLRSGEGCGFKLWCKLGRSKPQKPAKKSAARADLRRESPAPALRAGYPAPQAPGGLALLSVVPTQGEGGCNPPWGGSHRHVVIHKMLSSFRNGGALRVCGASEPGTGCAPPQHTQGAHTLRAQAIPTTWAAWRRCAKSYGLRHVVVHMRCFRLSIFAPALHQESVPTPRGRLLQPASSHKVKLQRMRTKFVHSRFKLDELFSFLKLASPRASFFG